MFVSYAVDIGQTSHTFEITLGAYDYDMTVCTDLPVVQDNIVEPDESFTVRILRTNSKIPAGVLSHLKLNTEAAVITIQDTSEFTNAFSVVPTSL